MKRKLTYHDRIMALAFNHRYCQEFKKLYGGSSLPSLEVIFSPDDKIGNFKKRWGLEFDVDPDGVKRRLGEDPARRDIEGGVFSDYHEMLKVIQFQKADEKDGFLNLSQHLRDGRYLTLQIDVTADKGEILEAIGAHIDFYRSIIKFRPSDKRAKPSELSHWFIYKEHAEGKTLLRIAKDLAGINKGPAYSEQVNAKYKQVLRAYQKAKEMISQTKPVE